MVQQIAELNADDAIVCAQLRSLRVTREEWDDNGAGGHFWFEISAPRVDHDFDVIVNAEDEDGGLIEIILHSVGGLLNWAEWFRYDGSVLRWPPPSVERFDADQEST